MLLGTLNERERNIVIFFFCAALFQNDGFYVNYGDCGNALASFEDVHVCQVVVYSAMFSLMMIIWAPKISKTINLTKNRNALTVPFKVGHCTILNSKVTPPVSF